MRKFCVSWQKKREIEREKQKDYTLIFKDPQFEGPLKDFSIKNLQCIFFCMDKAKTLRKTDNAISPTSNFPLSSEPTKPHTVCFGVSDSCCTYESRDGVGKPHSFSKYYRNSCVRPRIFRVSSCCNLSMLRHLSGSLFWTKVAKSSGKWRGNIDSLTSMSCIPFSCNPGV